MDRSANIVVHLSCDAKHTVVLPNVATTKSVASVLHEALYHYARSNRDAAALSVSGLYDMYSGEMLDLSASLHSVATFHTATKCMRLGAVPHTTNDTSDNNNSNKSRSSDSPFESFVKSIFSSSDDTPSRPAQLPPQAVAAPSLVECIAQLRAASIDELCTECGVAPEAAVDLVRQLQDFASGARAFGLPDVHADASSASSTASEDDPLDADDQDDEDNSLGEAPILLAYAHDSPAFRREVAAIDAAWPRLITDFGRVVAAAKAALASSKCHLATLRDLYTELTAPIDETSCLRHLAGSAKRAWAPLTDSCDRSMDALRVFSSDLATEFIAPLETLLTHDLGRDAAASRERLNAAFYAYWAMAHEATSDAVGDDARLEAARHVFESARLSTVRHVNEAFLRALCVVERTGCAMAHDANAVVGRRRHLEVHCAALEACDIVDIWAGAPRGYLFHVEDGTSARTRRWFYLENGTSTLMSLQADRRTPEVIAHLSQCTVSRNDSMRYGICLTWPSNRVLLQADTARLHALWLEALTATKTLASTQDDLQDEDDDENNSNHEATTRPTLEETPRTLLTPIAFFGAPASAFAVMARSTLPISVQTYFERFVSDEHFTRAFLAQRGATDVALSHWTVRSDGAYGRSRRIQLPVETALSTGSTRVHACEVYHRRSCDHLEVLAKDESLDVPYGSYFVVESRTTVVGSMGSSTTCAVEMAMAVYFTKSTMFQRMIEKACAAETKASCEAMLAAMRTAIDKAL
ncbi:hypothetical protein SDRG_07365 [Saprolegnia diclina VS20]|uniref:VASt domain-containing protein n=1 Tax=Saprolegnia diclina (strain VS20) TaxID=1156394 RepID=T0RXR2_SAPDV|nr:hypothetical protein SDRG_07365 [Saprolegnia diclina VS20]EQC35132.1 hypothetical protein SDRG_07365 [Saprolegnia diclina VS20]|eukprot:XP_008611416.1 hypothetical protein SDRG_07365 [Saprolegnia diclina VS20]